MPAPAEQFPQAASARQPNRHRGSGGVHSMIPVRLASADRLNGPSLVAGRIRHVVRPERLVEPRRVKPGLRNRRCTPFPDVRLGAGGGSHGRVVKRGGFTADLWLAPITTSDNICYVTLGVAKAARCCRKRPNCGALCLLSVFWGLAPQCRCGRLGGWGLCGIGLPE